MLIKLFLILLNFINYSLSYHEEFKLDQVLHHGIEFQDIFRSLNIEEKHIHEDQKRHNVPFTHTIKRIPMPIDNKIKFKKNQQFFTKRINRTIPDVTDKGTILSLARMTFNAYITPSNPNWLDLGNDVKEREPFGWEEGENGLRGYVFANKDNSSIIVSFKGTSAGLVGGDSKTSGKDKLNDNLLFSCCCARVDQTWYKVCDCFEGGNKCNGQCLEKSLAANNTDIYYFAAQKILRKIEDMYQGADIWLTGHSLGGGLAALLGLTYNLPTVTFQAPGDKRAFERLQLPGIPAIDPEEAHIWHFGHNTDPIYMGECQGVLSACYIGGYAMESKCHTGKICVYDTKKERDWSMDILKHRIGVVIEEVINYFDDVPECKLENPECKDCISWLY